MDIEQMRDVKNAVETMQLFVDRVDTFIAAITPDLQKVRWWTPEHDDMVHRMSGLCDSAALDLELIIKRLNPNYKRKETEARP